MRLLIALVCFTSPALAVAQLAAPRWIPIDSSRPLRVELRNGALVEGHMVRQTAESLTVRVTDRDTAADRVLRVGDISTVAIPEQRHSGRSTLKGLGIGFLIGTAVGSVVAGIENGKCSNKTPHNDMCGMSVLYIPAGAIVGALTGTVIGAVRTHEEWAPVWHPDRAER
jgi:hypothetical protein